MRTWRSDPRFLCPMCGQLIQLKYFYSRDGSISVHNTVASCGSCQRVFMVADWRKRHGPFRPRTDVMP